MVARSGKVLKVGLTGPVASGKSTALKFFEHLGACVFSADRCLHSAYTTNTYLQDQIVQLFGENIISDGQINREKLAQIVFASLEQLTQLESVTHPFVFNEMQKAYRDAHSSVFIAEIPLLLESKTPFLSWFDVTIDIQREYLDAQQSFLSSGKTKEEFESRMARFLPNEERQNQCTYTLNNSSSLKALENEVQVLYNTLKA